MYLAYTKFTKRHLKDFRPKASKYSRRSHWKDIPVYVVSCTTLPKDISRNSAPKHPKYSSERHSSLCT
ncbi:hypothetical protein CEXT_171651 [Caerostris extrusa]|uniref:Uncharacterized protein n=1 Tax=Caerostris extrusa TaxID=172846 RepID=A0AAV4QWU2_CAEEX|nr:hypothetical protein CEXT_171651 [Caerostris extrusa]